MNEKDFPAWVEIDDAELVARSVAGEVAAFRTIADRYYSLLRDLAYEATGSAKLSDELARDTLIVAWRELRAFPEPVRFRSWLCGIAHKVTSEFLRRRAGLPLAAPAAPAAAGR
jgi:RNA polymerase sigma-70 factor, ECF subfamily